MNLSGACVASIVKTTIQSHVLDDPDFTRNFSYLVWNSIELYVGILASSLPPYNLSSVVSSIKRVYALVKQVQAHRVQRLTRNSNTVFSLKELGYLLFPVVEQRPSGTARMM